MAKTKVRTDYDSPWKEIIERFFREFVQFFLPAAYAEIDWSRPPEFLDKELQRVVGKAKMGRHTVDKLVKVYLIDGTDAWLLIHIEVQGQVEEGFARRMFVYCYRIFDRYGKEVISFAILSDEDPTWRPEEYSYTRWGCQLQLHFPTVKLLDYAEQWAMLEQSTNPFALVVMTHLKTQATHRQPKNRLRWKIEMVKQAYARGYSREYLWELFRFIDWIMVLPEKYELQFEKAIKEVEEGENMRYVTGIERRAIKKGMDQGLEQGVLKTAREDVIDILTERFQTIPEPLIAQINALNDPAQLKGLLKRAVTIPSLADFQRLLAEQARQPVAMAVNGA